jgi:hypothetical protein
MTSFRSAVALFGLLALVGVAVQVNAQEQVVTVSATRDQEPRHPACEGMSASESSRAAREAEKSGAYQQASECFLNAGEYLRANRAGARAAADAAAAQKRNATASAETVRAQAARLREAFR